jgi:methanogenic corrinoid protein MtbC1
MKDRQIDVVAISATITFHISKVRELLDQIRVEECLQKVKVIVGGYPFNISPNLWKVIGADGFARNADEAVEMARKLMENTTL